MGDYIDEVFEADCPKYVDFAEPQVLEDNADEWFNFDHENGIPVVYSPEKMDTGKKHNESEMQVTSDNEEYHECDPVPLTEADLAAPTPTLPLKTPLVLESTAPTNITGEDSTSSEDEKHPEPAPIAIADLANDSPAAPLQKPPVAAEMTESVEQNNLDLINVSGEGTPKDLKPVPAKQDIRPVNIVTSWDHHKDGDDPKPTGKAKPLHPFSAKLAHKTSGNKCGRRLSNSLRRTTRSVGGKMPSQASARSQSLKRRSANVASPAPKPTTAVQATRSNFVRSNSLRRSTRSVGAPTPPQSSTRSRSLTRRSAAASTKRTTSAEVGQGKRKRFSSPAPTRKSPRLQQKPKLTMPHTPVCLRRNMAKPGQSKFKSSEELEMERIKHIKQEAEKMKEISKKSHRQAIEAVSYHPTRSVTEPTRPLEFNFATDSRIKNHAMETRQDKEMKDFVTGLRKHAPSPKKNKGPTVPQPFHLSSNRKRQHEDSDPSEIKARKFKPMALQINEFHCRTPDRFRTKASKDINKGPNPMKAVHRKPTLTCPKTPALETKSRKRAVTAISAAEKEEMEVQEMKSYAFRARPIDPRVMSNVNIGVTRPQHKSPTKAVGFELESEKRFREREANKKPQEEEKFEFHARPLPSKMLDGPTGIAPVKALPITCPKSPAFALKNRVRVRKTSLTEAEEEESSRILHANPVPHTGVPFVPNLNHKVTEAKPFSFNNRDKEIQAKKEAKIQEIIREEEQLANQFKAQPLPYFEGPKLPEKKVKPSTKQEPFKLSIEQRGAKQAEQWSKKMEEELNEQRRQASSFKAKPADVLYEAPFVPLKSTKPLTDISEFDLNTDRRAVERQEFEEKKHAREAALRVANEERQRREEEEERLAIERLRQEMVHKSNPIRRFKSVEVLPSNRPLTQPESPHFATDARLRSQPRL